MINAKFFIACPVKFNNLCLVYPPKVVEVVTNENYNTYVNILTTSAEDIQDMYTEKGIKETPLTPFEYLLNIYYNNNDLHQTIIDAFQFFIHEIVTVLPQQGLIIIGDLAEYKSVDSFRIINKDNFFDFQNLIRESMGEKRLDPPKEDLDPRVARIKAKARYREKIKAKSNKSLKLTSILATICCMDLGLNPLNIGEISYASARLLMNYYQMKEKYRMDTNFICAGAQNVQVENWICNIED